MINMWANIKVTGGNRKQNANPNHKKAGVDMIQSIFQDKEY